MPAEEDGLMYAPNMIPDNPEDKVYCFVTADRVCGPDCMAFLTQAPLKQKNGELDDNQRHCSLLINADRLARHVVILTSIFASSEKKKQVAQQDQERKENTPKPGPFAGPTPTSPFPVEKT